jgi:uncharacterized membrane protein
MPIEDRIEEIQASRVDCSYTAGSDLLLVIAATLIVSPLLSLRPQMSILRSAWAHLLIWSFLLGAVALTILAVSTIDVDRYGRAIGIALFITGIGGTLTYGSLTNLFWSAWGMALVLIGCCVVVISSLSVANNSEPLFSVDNSTESFAEIYKNRFSKPPMQLFIILIASIIVLRFGTYFMPLLQRHSSLGGLAPFVGCLLIFYVPLRWAGVDRDREVVSFAVLAVIIWISMAFFTQPGSGVFGTDAILFSQYSTDLLLSGENPYSSSMAPAYERYTVDDRFVTYRIDGTIVTSLSYPAGAILVFLPQALADIPNLNFTTILFYIGVLVFLTADTRGALQFTPVAILLATQDFIFFSSGGVFDIIYVLFILLGMKFWSEEAYRPAALVVGLGFTFKQVPWIIGPFLAIWLYRTADSRIEFLDRVRGTLSYGFAGFLLPNLPFVIWGPLEWVRGVFTPIAGGAPLTMQGIGLASLSSMSIYYLPREYYLLLVFTALGVAMLLYAHYFDQLKWAAWILPAAIYFVHFRSLLNYFLYFLIIGYYAVLLQYRLTVPADEYRVLRWLKRATVKS